MSTVMLQKQTRDLIHQLSRYLTSDVLRWTHCGIIVMHNHARYYYTSAIDSVVSYYRKPLVYELAIMLRPPHIRFMSSLLVRTSDRDVRENGY